jgi:hypothetical protein
MGIKKSVLVGGAVAAVIATTVALASACKWYEVQCYKHTPTGIDCQCFIFFCGSGYERGCPPG